MQIRWTPSAAEDLETLITYIHADDPIAAEELAQRVFDRLEQLCTFPGMGRPSEQSGTRELIVYPFVIIYRVGADVIEPIRVWHGAQSRQ